jgi:stage IV sporulation protein FA
MKNRADEIRKRYSQKVGQKRPGQRPSYSQNNNPLNSGSPFEPANKVNSSFIMRVMGAVCLFLLVGILFKSQGSQLEPAKLFVKNTFENEFKFAKVSAWYEGQFGKPLALLPTNGKESEPGTDTEVNIAYAIPAAGKVTLTQSFQDNGQGIMLETGIKSDVVAVNSGYVTYIGEKDTLGNTVIIQHSDGSETWYGKLDSFNENLKLYDVIEKGAVVGKVTDSKTNTGLFYFAMKQDNSFIDPLKVLNFD